MTHKKWVIIDDSAFYIQWIDVELDFGCSVVSEQTMPRIVILTKRRSLSRNIQGNILF